jgi:hypothetical protein
LLLGVPHQRLATPLRVTAGILVGGDVKLRSGEQRRKLIDQRRGEVAHLPPGHVQRRPERLAVQAEIRSHGEDAAGMCRHLDLRDHHHVVHPGGRLDPADVGLGVGLRRCQVGELIGDQPERVVVRKV